MKFNNIFIGYLIVGMSVMAQSNNSDKPFKHMDQANESNTVIQDRIFPDYQCGWERGIVAPLNIEIQSPYVSEKLRGSVSCALEFKDEQLIDLEIINIAVIRITNPSNRQIQYIYFSGDVKDSIFLFYEKELIPIFEKLKYWWVPSDHPNRLKRIHYIISFDVIPLNGQCSKSGDAQKE